MTAPAHDTILTVAETCHRLSLSEPTLRRYTKAGIEGFPKKLRLGPRRVGFSSRDVADYIEGKREPLCSPDRS